MTAHALKVTQTEIVDLAEGLREVFRWPATAIRRRMTCEAHGDTGRGEIPVESQLAIFATLAACPYASAKIDRLTRRAAREANAKGVSCPRIDEARGTSPRAKLVRPNPRRGHL